MVEISILTIFLNVANKKNEKMRKEKGNINFPHKIAL
jgi:hypothetical protein